MPRTADFDRAVAHEKSDGALAYAAYHEARSETCPEWETLPEGERQAWAEVGMAVSESYSAEIMELMKNYADEVAGLEHEIKNLQGLLLDKTKALLKLEKKTTPAPKQTRGRRST